MEHVYVRNWKKHQHYKAEKPKWIKWYREVTNDLDWLGLEEEGKLLWPYILLVAAETVNEIPNDPELLALRLRLKTSTVRKGVDSLLNSGFLQLMHTDSEDARKFSPNASARTRSVSVSSSGSGSKSNGWAAEFDLFWNHYPKRMGKKTAIKAWKETAEDRPPIDVLIVKVDELATSRDWMKDKGQFVPHPATWLRRGGWDDEVRK